MMGFAGVVKVDDVAGDDDGLGEVDWNDRDAINEWLERQPRQREWLLKVRSSLRIFPSSSHVNREKFDQFLILRFRVNLTSALFGYLAGYSDKDEVLIENAMEASNEQFMEFANANPDIRLAIHVDSIPGQMELESEALQFDSRQSVKVLQKTQLWPTDLLTEEMLSRLQVFEEKMKHSESWVFWADWFRGMWEGTWTNWDLALDVVKIETAIWERGLDEVAAEIEKIKARRHLETEIAGLKEQLRRTRASFDLPSRRHNNPPPNALIEIEEEIGKEATLIWDQIGEIEEEVSKGEPDASKLNDIARTLWDISVRIAAYCGSLADTVLQESAKVIGKTGTQAGIAVLTTTTAAQNEGVKAVAKAVWEFVKTLPPG